MDFELERELVRLFWECVSAHCAAVQATMTGPADETVTPEGAKKLQKGAAKRTRKRQPSGTEGAEREARGAEDALPNQSLAMFHFSRLRIFLKEIDDLTASPPAAPAGLVSQIGAVCSDLLDRARTAPDLVALLAESNLRLLGAEGLLLVQPDEPAGSQPIEEGGAPAKVATRRARPIPAGTIDLLEEAGKGNRGSIDGRMLDAILKDPTAIGWTAVRWAEHLKCARSSVIATQTWKELQTIRKEQRQDG
ncbi:MAG: hypothetical protein ACOX1P_01685 [Thermoguttaceae bacterium]|jgi:hypothetical protein